MPIQIETVRDMMAAIQDEIEKAKSGELKPQVASIVFRGRALQLKTAQLNLQYQRMLRESTDSKKNKKTPSDFRILSGEPVLEPAAKGTD